jgi:hypothetical protein
MPFFSLHDKLTTQVVKMKNRTMFLKLTVGKTARLRPQIPWLFVTTMAMVLAALAMVLKTLEMGLAAMAMVLAVLAMVLAVFKAMVLTVFKAMVLAALAMVLAA